MDTAPRRIELLPHDSLSARGATLFFAAVASTSLAVAMLFVVQGYWPVLPFAGLELGLLGWALVASRDRPGEIIEITTSEVVVTTRRREGELRSVFSRHWAHVTLRGPRGSRSGRLQVGSHGRAVEVGSGLGEDDRRALGRRLGALIGSRGESPELVGGAVDTAASGTAVGERGTPTGSER